jgi:hypothetical protein
MGKERSDAEDCRGRSFVRRERIVAGENRREDCGAGIHHYGTGGNSESGNNGHVLGPFEFQFRRFALLRF